MVAFTGTPLCSASIATLSTSVHFTSRLLKKKRRRGKSIKRQKKSFFRGRSECSFVAAKGGREGGVEWDRWQENTVPLCRAVDVCVPSTSFQRGRILRLCASFSYQPQASVGRAAPQPQLKQTDRASPLLGRARYYCSAVHPAGWAVCHRFFSLSLSLFLSLFLSFSPGGGEPRPQKKRVCAVNESQEGEHTLDKQPAHKSDIHDLPPAPAWRCRP